MPVVTNFPTANEVESTGWTDPNNAHADDGAYATTAPAKNNGKSTRWLTFEFDSNVPSGATINSVKIIYEYKVSTTSSIATMRVRAVVGGVNEEDHDDTSEPTTDTQKTVDITADRTWTRDNLLNANFKVTGDGRRGNSNTAVTLSLDYVKVEVNYTEPATQLVIQEGTHAHAADNLALTQHNLLSVSDAAHIYTSDAIALTQHNILAIGDATHGYSTDNVVLTAHDPATQLVIQDATHSNLADSVILVQHNVLAIGDAVHDHAVDNITLTYHAPGEEIPIKIQLSRGATMSMSF